MAHPLLRPLIAGTALSLCLPAAHAQTVEFRMREMTGQTAITSSADAVLDFVLEARVTGTSTPMALASFGLNIFYWGGENSGTMTRLRINNSDLSLYTGAPSASTTGGGIAGMAFQYRALVNQNPANNGLINPAQSASGFVNTNCSGELSGIRGAVDTTALVTILDMDADGIPDSSPLNGSGQPVPVGSIAPIPNDIGSWLFGFDGSFVQLYRFRFTNLSGLNRSITLHLAEPPTVFSQLRRTASGWEPVTSPASVSNAPLLGRWDNGFLSAYVDRCPPDYNGLNGLNVQDIFDFLNAWFNFCNLSFCPRTADYNCNGVHEPQDIFDFLNDWFVGCP